MSDNLQVFRGTGFSSTSSNSIVEDVNQRSFQELPSGDQASTSFYSGAQNLQNLPSLFQEDTSNKIHYKPLLNRKMVDYISAQRRDRSSFQVGKKRKISGERSATCSDDISKVLSPKRLKMSTEKEEKDDTRSPSFSKVISPNDLRLKLLKRKTFRSQSDDRQSDNTPRKKQRKEDENVTKIWIIGSSYIKRAEEPAREMFGENFGLNAKVQWFGKGGMRWSEVLPRFYTQLSTQSSPDILVVHAGGNNLGLTSARELTSQMIGDLMQLHQEFPSMTIAYSCINQRQSWRYGEPKWIDNDRKAINRAMREAVGSFNGEVIEHPLLRYLDDSVFLPDKVHFTRKGNDIFLTSVRNVIKKILQYRGHDDRKIK